MPWPARASPTPRRSNRRPVWPPPNSTGEPSLGSGDGLPRPGVTIGMLFLIVFKELRTSIYKARLARGVRPMWIENAPPNCLGDNAPLARFVELAYRSRAIRQ